MKVKVLKTNIGRQNLVPRGSSLSFEKDCVPVITIWRRYGGVCALNIVLVCACLADYAPELLIFTSCNYLSCREYLDLVLKR